jgi:isoleucyl-tRNA synthetase
VASLTPVYIERCADNFYKWQEANRSAANTFILSDGPPYANGALHVGHALNKILKDMILRVKVQQGRRVRYLPGWDCHGLPIELKALVDNPTAKSLPPTKVRAKAQSLATKTITRQMAEFRSYAVMGDWDRRWTTMDPAYEVAQLRVFQCMVERGLVYRAHKPVYWSPSSRTALAEAELEYRDDHVSTAAYVRLRLTGDMTWLSGVVGDRPVHAVVWTTTPWTLPANKAVAVNRSLEYTVIVRDEDALVVETSCTSRLREAGVEWPATAKTVKITGKDLVGLQYQHIFDADEREENSRRLPILHADFVTNDSGSGLVHIAPGHGFEDYQLCKSNNIHDLDCPVDGEGRYITGSFTGKAEKLHGIQVQKEGTEAVLDLLGPAVLKVHEYRHKYPYDWRTKKPVIVRATSQWFADVAAVKEQASAALESVKFIPEGGKTRLNAFISGRSEWCISRQRAWGVPIPALFDKEGEAVLTEESVAHIISVIKDRGTNAWWSDDAADLAWIPESMRKNGPYVRGTSTMDVWFDSGTSWAQSDGQADVYLEGSDQHRGWFQSSLLTRVAAAPRSASVSALSPFKTLITHGFTLDAAGKKMSKSLGNIISPADIMSGALLPPPKKGTNALGPDALRLWAAGSDYTRDVSVGQAILQTVQASLLRYRTTLKMLLGSLQPPASPDAPPPPVLTPLDRIALLQLRDLLSEARTAYEAHEFGRALTALNRWLATDLSAFYLEAIKDRIYCGPADPSGTIVLGTLLAGFLRILAPVAPVLVEEAWDHAPAWWRDGPAGGVHPLQAQWDDALLPGAPALDESGGSEETKLRALLPHVAALHAAVRTASEKARAEKLMGSSLMCRVGVVGVPPDSPLRALAEDELAEMCVVSELAFAETEDGAAEEGKWRFAQDFEVGTARHTVFVSPPRDHKCPRCWRYIAPTEDALCGRCEEVVSGLEA